MRLRLGTRGSALAVGQSGLVADALRDLIAALRSVVTLVELPGNIAAQVTSQLQYIKQLSAGLAAALDTPRSAAGEAAMARRAMAASSLGTSGP